MIHYVARQRVNNETIMNVCLRTRKFNLNSQIPFLLHEIFVRALKVIYFIFHRGIMLQSSMCLIYMVLSGFFNNRIEYAYTIKPLTIGNTIRTFYGSTSINTMICNTISSFHCHLSRYFNVNIKLYTEIHGWIKQNYLFHVGQQTFGK